MRDKAANLPSWPLDTPLVNFTKNQAFTIRQAFEGVQIFGGIGSGKTSGSGRTLAHAFLRFGFGGLVLCVKPDEADTWRRYAVETGREASFLFIDGRPGQGFNFLDYELRAYSHEGNQVNNAVEVFMHVMKSTNGDEKKGDGSPFWDNSVRDLLRACLTALHIAYGHATLEEVFRMAITAYTDERQLQDPHWLATSYCSRTLQLVEEKADQRDALAVRVYFRHIWGGMDSRLKSNITATLSSLCGSFMLGRLRDMFCSGTSFLPEMAHYGAVIVLDMPVKTWQQDGIVAQHIIKYAFQRATERRGDRGGNVFLWVDESQVMLSDYDSEFQSTARASRVATVYLTQNINMYHRAIGGADARHTVHGLLGNLKTKIFHANDDIDTNQYAADLIGTKLHLRYSSNRGGNTGYSEGESTSEAYGQSHSRADGYSSSYSKSDTISQSESQGHNNGISASYSATVNTQGTGSSRGVSLGSSSGRSTSTSKSRSTTTSHTESDSHTYTAGTSETYTAGRNTGTSRGESWSQGVSEQKDLAVEPHDFRTKLATGGPQNGFRVDGVLVQTGYGAPQYSLVHFSQR